MLRYVDCRLLNLYLTADVAARQLHLQSLSQPVSQAGREESDIVCIIESEELRLVWSGQGRWK